MAVHGARSADTKPSDLIPRLNEKLEVARNFKKQVDISHEALQHTVEIMGEMKSQVDESFRILGDELRAVANIPVADLEKLKAFGIQPYAILPRKKNEWWIVTPKWTGFRIGWLDHEDDSHYYFVINTYMRWLGDIPKDIEEKLRFKAPVDVRVNDGILYTNTRKEQETAWRRYGEHLLKKEGDDKSYIKRGHEIDLLAKIIADGGRPWTQNPVKPEHWRDDVQVSYPFDTLRDYQQEELENFRKMGSMGIYWPMSAGKTVLGLHVMAHIRGRKLIVVPSAILKEQWAERINSSLGSRVRSEVDIVTYHAYERVRNNEYVLAVFDENHRLPANTFSRLSMIRTHYRLGLSATPFREDGRTDLIFALTGFPQGMDWNQIIKEGYINIPRVRVLIVRDGRDKIARLDQLMADNRKTIIYSYWLPIGRQLANHLDLPFVSGETPNKLESIQQSLDRNSAAVVSSVGTEGLSLPQLQRIIEVGFLYGSRREEAQLVGRLFHSQERESQVEHYILMTQDELDKYEKRLFALTEKNINVEIVT